MKHCSYLFDKRYTYDSSKFPQQQIFDGEIVTSLVTNSITIVYEGISSYYITNDRKHLEGIWGNGKYCKCGEKQILSFVKKLSDYAWYIHCRNSRKDSTIQKMHKKQCGMKNCFQLGLIVGITSIYQNKKLYIML